MMDVVRQPVQEDRTQQARRAAEERFHDESDWVRFYREVLGVDGVVDQLFPTFTERSQFEKSPEYTEIQQMLAKLRERNRVQKNGDEPTRVITVRLPQSLHEALRHEAHNHKTSMNKLCISKLLQVIAGELVPSDFERREEEEAEYVERPRATVSAPVWTPAATIPVQSYAATSQPLATVHAPAVFAPRPLGQSGGTNF